MSAEPNVFVLSQLDGGLKRFAESPPHQAVGSVSANKQIARLELIQVGYVRVEPNIDAEIGATLLQDIQKRKSRDTGKIISANGDLLGFVNDVDVVPPLTSTRDLCEGWLVVVLEIGKSLIRKNDAPTEGIIRVVALEDSDLVRAILFFH